MSTVDEIEEAIDRLPENSRWKQPQRFNARLCSSTGGNS